MSLAASKSIIADRWQVNVCVLVQWHGVRRPSVLLLNGSSTQVLFINKSYAYPAFPQLQMFLVSSVFLLCVKVVYGRKSEKCHINAELVMGPFSDFLKMHQIVHDAPSV